MRAVRSLYDWSWSLVCIAGGKSDLFPVRVGLCQGCPLSPIPIFRCIQGDEAVLFGDLRIKSLLFADDVVLLALLVQRPKWRSLSTDRRVGAASAVMRSLPRSTVVNRGLNRKAKPPIYWSIFVPTLTNGHELELVTKRTRLRVQEAEMSFLRRVAGLSLRDRVRSSLIWEEFGVESLLFRTERCVR